MRLSVSSCNKVNMCRRLYYIEKVLGYKDISPKPWLTFGSAFGELMAHVDVLGVEKGIQKIPELFSDPYKAINAEYMVRKWDFKYGSAPQPVTTIDGKHGNEFEIELDLSHLVNDRFELIFTGFIDKVYELEGEPLICERKTTNDVINSNSVYWRRLNFDPQIVGYSWGLSQILGTSVDRGTYEVFRKPTERIDKVFKSKGYSESEYRRNLLKTPSMELSRHAEMVSRKEYFITDEMRDNWLFEFVQTAEEIYDSRELSNNMDTPEYEWKRNKDACDMFLPCIYKEFCGCKATLADIPMAVKDGD